MKLVSLEIKVNGENRRLIKFHDGLNLITNRKEIGRSGNGVGKSTLSRVVDFLFLGSIDAIYIDDEYKKPNPDIESLFNNQNVEAELVYIGLDERLHQLQRNFAIKSENCIYIVDGKIVEANDYEKNIQKFFFNITTRRPSVRFLAPKFIRNDSYRMLNTTHFLGNWANDKDYDELFLFLFGFNNTELLTEKRNANNLVKKRKRIATSLNTIVTEQKPQAAIKKYIDESKLLEAELMKFDYAPDYNNPIARLTELQVEEDTFTEALLHVDRKITNIHKTIELLSNTKGSYLGNELRAIYEYAGLSVDGAIRDLEDVFLFHENLISRKKQFLTVELPNFQQEKVELEAELYNIGKNKLKVFTDMRSTESINNITNNLKKLGILNTELGKLQGLLEQKNKSNEDLYVAKKELTRILTEISKELENVRLFSSSLNKMFKKITKEIHNEEYELVLNINNETGSCSVDVKNTVSNPEGGKNKAEVIAFDFAYIHAVSETHIKRPKFVFHDSIEDIDQKQINEIFTQAKMLLGQQIISMLSDKLSDEMYEKYLPDVVLFLDEKDMFFGV